eukprot:CAMPEP_0113643358 /NCGR_PEP_ID=MMETSP0017_2-20120614/22798_1 /TAXON_ID=2856 /ORGANISM="Cylindrotheca closterium" /LENGTH=319 /DNA_ID=CAMNT_0000554869 /DNA_START=148 /DNA_END=1108 /DNA_ORIENTATION=- /assembly_acc=CAM_ASM_000147
MPSRTRLQMTNQPLLQDEDDEEAFRNLYREQSTEGMLLGKEFEQRQTQLEKDRKRLTETFNIDASMNSEDKSSSAIRANMQASKRPRGASNKMLCCAALVFVSSTLLSPADAMICKQNNHRIVAVSSSSTTPLRTRLQMTNQPLLQDEDDEEAFRNLYQEQSTEGMLLGKEFEQRQTQLEKDRKRLTETFNIDASMNSASLFNTANAVVMSTPSVALRNKQSRRLLRSTTPAPANAAEDNWALILCMSLSAQLSQQAAVLQEFYPQQQQQQRLQLQKQQSVVILFCALALLLASTGYLEILPPPPQDSEIPSLTSFHIL